MAAVKYSLEQKTNALNLIREKGVAKAHEELGISIQTLYKWRNEANVDGFEAVENAGKLPVSAKKAKVAAPSDDIKKLIKENDGTKATIEALQAENEALRQMNKRLTTALMAFIE